MIVGLEGIVESRGNDFVVIKVGGVSLRVFAPTSTLAALGSPGERVRLHTHFHIREDNLSLYGFASTQELELFQMLLGVSGVGPRIALSLLSALNAEELASAIASENVEPLTRVTGVGKKTAQRIILELKDKLAKMRIAVPTVSALAANSEVIEALKSLGYSASEAASAVATLPPSPGLSLEDKVRLTLQALGRR